MATKVKVKIDLPTLDNLKKEIIADSKFQNNLGNKVVDEIKDMVSVGVSPVSGQGRYKGYAVDRKSNPNAVKGKRISKRKDLYPNSVQKNYPSKQRRPVNLKLSGDMLDAFSFKGIFGGVRVGLFTASEKLKTIFKAHNDQSDSKRPFPRRAMIPTGDGESFVPKIRRIIRDEYSRRIREIIKRGK